ncbi:pyridoxal phosphate-dependent decarboxylase family protein [Planctomicrobium sp. SH664]|uniref:pyridoxal phosphate-dependent decarboxylase family protein n=1 Tax=Planctomicrobium sp. SH664 TaxID=3448125 RepID=UPI003F5ADF76
MDDIEIGQARHRIRNAYSPAVMRELLPRFAGTLARHYEQVTSGEGPVLNWNPASRTIPAAQSELRAGLPDLDTSAVANRFLQLLETALGHGHNLHHPHYIGHQVPPPLPIAGLFDALAKLTNQVMAIYEMSPWATAVEHAVISELGQRFGLPADSFAGLVTNGGSLANLTALLTARNVCLADSWEHGVASDSASPVLICQGDSHYGVSRSAGILGLGTRQIIRIPVDSRRKMDTRRLREVLSTLRQKGTPIVAVCACAGATLTGSFDPLEEIADLCAEYKVWLHVDAAHGGAVALSARHRHLIQGIERADSFICDAHKMLFVPALCAFVFYRNPAHRYEAFRQDAPYLFDPSAPGLAEFDGGLKTIECTKQAAAYGLWGLWSTYGPGLFEDLVNVTFAAARSLYEKVLAADDFEALNEPEANILVFRYIPAALRGTTDETRRAGELNRAIRRRLIESGEFYIVQTTVEEAGALRVTVMNPLTDDEQLDQLLNAIRRVGHELQNG